MNKYKYQIVWLTLPAVLVVLYFAIFQPQPDALHAFGRSSPSVATANTGLARVTEPVAAAQANIANTVKASSGNASNQIPDADNQNSEEVAKDREYIDYALPLLSTWDLQKIKPILADETIAASTDEELNEVMSTLEHRLGGLRYFDTPQPVATLNTEEQQAKDGKLQLYQFIAYYETGEAQINLILHRKLDNDNSLYSFNINVPN